jgi:hypothetical protein
VVGNSFLASFNLAKTQITTHNIDNKKPDGPRTDVNNIAGSGDLHYPCLLILDITLAHRSLHWTMVRRPFPKPRRLLVRVLN